MFDKFYNLISNDIGIDLGTASTLVYLKGHGIVINEPSVVVVNQKTGQIIAVGMEAKEMLAYLINKAEKISKKFIRPRVIVGVPTGITNVEIRAVEDAARSAGAR